MSSEKPMKKTKFRTIIYAAIGTMLEWYNFSIYVYITAVISVLFFPKGDQLIAIISSFGIFAGSYLIRPLGGIVFGSLGDKIGRKKVLIISITLMGLSVLFIGLLPTYHTIGIFAPMLLTLAMLLQGFSMGGQYSGVQVMLVEQATKDNRGFVSAFGTLVSGCGVLLSTLVITLLEEFLTKQQLHNWGWRIPFLLGVILSIVIIFMQTKMHESPHFEKLKKKNVLSKSPVKDLFKHSKMKLLTAVVVIGFSSLSYYMIAAFLPTYLSAIIGFKPATIMVITTLTITIYAFSAPVWGALSDSFGRKKVLGSAVVLLFIFTYPAFYVFLHANMYLVCLAEIIMILPVSAFAATCCSAVNEQFTTKERFSGGAIGINIGVAIGGLTPLFSTELINITKNNTSPAILLMVGAIIAIIVIWKMKETARVELKEY